MRRILTRESKERKERRGKIIIGLFLVAIMVLGTAGYAFFSGSRENVEKIKYNDIEFVLGENNLWGFEIQGSGQTFHFQTQYNPKETENISIPVFMTVNNYAGRTLFFVGKGTAKQEIIQNLWNFISKPNDACLDGYEDICGEDVPIKNCSEDNIIIIEEGEYIEVNQEDNCVFISSPPEEQARVADAFLFRILGVKGF